MYKARYLETKNVGYHLKIMNVEVNDENETILDMISDKYKHL